MNWKRWLWVGVSCTALAACSSSSPAVDGGGGQDAGGGGGGGDAGADAGVAGDAGQTQACTDEANAVCNEISKCSDGGFLIARDYGDLTTCQSRIFLNCAAGVYAPGTGQTPTRIETCVAQYGSYACADYFDSNPPGACVPPAGSLANGATCGAAGQCQSAWCGLDSMRVCATCQPLPAPGAPCLVQADCGRDLACAIPTGSTSGTCAAFVGSGGACLTGVAPCQAGFACVGDNTTNMTMGTCQAQAATLAAACDGSRKTAPNCNFDLGLVCIPAAAGSPVGTCKPLTLVGAGGTCGNLGAAPITGVAVCSGGGLCVKAMPTSATGTCVAPAADHAACDSAAGPPCLLPAKCVPTTDGGTAGTCTPPDPTKC